MPEADYGRSTRWLTVLTVDPTRCGVTRDQIIDKLEAENIEARPVWKPMQLQPLYARFPYYEHEPGNSVSERLFEIGLCLPSGSNLSEAEQDRVIDSIKGCFK
jgi:pyridoxal phosphate-dependent aminotransferase EpsN